MRKVLYIGLVLFVIIACNKRKPRVGDYEALFYGSYTKNGQTISYDRFRDLSIIEVNATEIVIAACPTCEAFSTLKKDNKAVSGIIPMPGQGGTGGPSFPSNQIYITGTWQKNKGKYIISGFHQYVYTDIDAQNQTINEYVVSGDFEIKSK